MSKHFIIGERTPTEDLGGGVARQILGYGPDILMARVTFEVGSIGPLHRHHHVQATYVESGLFEVTIGKEKSLLRAGDGFYIPPHVEHGAVCVEAGVLLDVFNPVRKDFLEGKYYGDDN